MVVIFGLGFVGLTSALGFSEIGNKVYGIEVNPERLQLIKSGKLPFFEPGLDEALIRHLGKNFIPTTDLKTAISDSDIIYYCVGTPYGAGGAADLTYLFGAIDQTISIIKELNDGRYRVLVVKSTIPPSTCSTKIIPYVESKGLVVGKDIGVADNPEFLREGHCWDDFMNPDRIVLGTSDEKASALLQSLYKPMNVPIHVVSLNTSEFIKYLSNTLLATLISYANEMSIIADKIGDINTAEAFRILAEDKRWKNGSMATYAYPGCGYGGYCLPKDTNAMYALANSYGYTAPILRNVILTNDSMPNIILKRIINISKSNSDKIGILGLSFKPESDDVRDTPAAKIIRKLQEKGYRYIAGYDPKATEEFKKFYPDLKIRYYNTMDGIINSSDVLIILTAWSEFKGLQSLTDKPIVDCRFML